MLLFDVVTVTWGTLGERAFDFVNGASQQLQYSVKFILPFYFYLLMGYQVASIFTTNMMIKNDVYCTYHVLKEQWSWHGELESVNEFDVLTTGDSHKTFLIGHLVTITSVHKCGSWDTWFILRTNIILPTFGQVKIAINIWTDCWFDSMKSMQAPTNLNALVPVTSSVLFFIDLWCCIVAR